MAANKEFIQQKEKLKAEMKGLPAAGAAKIEDEIDEINDKIRANNKEIQTTTEQRETAIAEEATARTEMTYSSQKIKKIETFEKHASEQIAITEVVIKSKKEKASEEKEKKNIVGKQVDCFKKFQEVNAMKEKLK